MAARRSLSRKTLVTFCPNFVRQYWYNRGMLVLLSFAFLAGLVTVVSPCVLPVLPFLLSTSVDGGRRRPLGIVLGLAITFAAVTLLVTAAASALAVPATWLRLASIVLLGLFGLSMLVSPLGRAFERLTAPLTRIGAAGMGKGGTQRTGFGGGVLIGAGLGFVWAPCVGPIMGSVIGLTAAEGITSQAVAITLAYSLGGALPMLFIAYGARSLAARAKKFAPRSAKIRVLFGALTVLAAAAILFGFDTKLQDMATRYIPGWSNTLTSVERQDAVDKELGKLDTNVAQVPANAPASQPDTQAQAPVAEAPAAQAPQGQEAQAPAVVAAAPTATEVPPPPTAVPPTAVPPTAAPKPAIVLQDLGPAPEITGITGWFNTANGKPLTIKGLEGKVVLIDFWTFGCYNCRNTRPHVRALYDKYKDQGLEIIGVHTPEFSYERVPDNIKNAAQEQGVIWPIAMDPDFKTWRAYDNHYWPALYFIDAKGHLRYSHFGEGNYEYNEQVVQQLLSEAKKAN